MDVEKVKAVVSQALRDADVTHKALIEDLKANTKKLDQVVINEMVATETQNWHEFYASFIVERLEPMMEPIVSNVATAASAALPAPGW